MAIDFKGDKKNQATPEEMDAVLGEIGDEDKLEKQRKTIEELLKEVASKLRPEIRHIFTGEKSEIQVEKPLEESADKDEDEWTAG